MIIWIGGKNVYVPVFFYRKIFKLLKLLRKFEFCWRYILDMRLCSRYGSILCLDLLLKALSALFQTYFPMFSVLCIIGYVFAYIRWLKKKKRRRDTNTAPLLFFFFLRSWSQFYFYMVFIKISYTFDYLPG